MRKYFWGIISVIIVLLTICLTSCVNQAPPLSKINDNSQFFENYDGSGNDVTIIDITSPESRSSASGQWIGIIIDNGVTEVYSQLNIVELEDGVTYTTHYDESGVVIASFILDDGNVVEIEISDEENPIMFGALKDWRDCVKNRYGEMMNRINNDKDSKGISDTNNALAPLITEVAVAAGIWCLDKDNRDSVL